MKYEEISFDFTDENGVTYVDGYSLGKWGRLLGYIINYEFYHAGADVLDDKEIMSIIDEEIENRYLNLKHKERNSK